METSFTLAEFRMAYAAGAFVRVTVRGHGSSFSIEGEMRDSRKIEGGRRGAVGQPAVLVMSRDRNKLRTFLNPAAALLLLRQSGVKRAEVQMANWEPEMTALSMRMRPDVTARRLRDRRIAEAAYYPDRAAETELVDRTDQLEKFRQAKYEQLCRLGG